MLALMYLMGESESETHPTPDLYFSVSVVCFHELLMLTSNSDSIAPVAWPIAKLLDWALGADEGHT